MKLTSQERRLVLRLITDRKELIRLQIKAQSHYHHSPNALRFRASLTKLSQKLRSQNPTPHQIGQSGRFGSPSK